MAIFHIETAGFLQLSINQDDLDRLLHSTLTPAALKRAQTRAINETTAWLKSRLLRELPGLTGIPRKVLAPRIKQSKAKTRTTGRISGMVWLGVKPVDAMALKDEGPSGQGYEAGGFYFPGGFKAFTKTHTGSMGIYARTGRDRLPVKRQNVKIDSFVNEAASRMIRPAEHTLAQKMQRLVGYELEQAAR
jgi:hypothetical protein